MISSASLDLKPCSVPNPISSLNNIKNQFLNPLWLTRIRWFRSVTDFEAFFATRNSVNLENKLSASESLPTQSILVSFDVVGLYPNVPILPSILEFIDILEKAAILPSTINEFVILFKLCLQPNFCQFNNNTFLLSEFIGVAMDSLTAPLVAEVFSNVFEHTCSIHY